jgi:hypothetical protein
MFRLLLILLCTLSLRAQAPPKAILSDPQIEAQLHTRLAKSVIGKDGFTARVKGGVVYWDGATAVAQHKGAATRMAKSAGARRVVNNIKVNKKSGAVRPLSQAVRPSAPSAKPIARSVSAAPLTPSAIETAPPLKQVTVQWREKRP